MATKQPAARAKPAVSSKAKKSPPARKSSATPRAKPPAKDVDTVKDKERKAPGEKQKTIRDSFNMPSADYALIGELKNRVLAYGEKMKKSELLRAGVKVLAGMNDAELKLAVAAVARVKRGRPTEKHK